MMPASERDPVVFDLRPDREPAAVGPDDEPTGSGQASTAPSPGEDGPLPSWADNATTSDTGLRERESAPEPTVPGSPQAGATRAAGVPGTSGPAETDQDQGDTRDGEIGEDQGDDADDTTDTGDPNDPDDAGSGGLQTPAEYLAELASLHQIVFLGDLPGIRSHVEFLAEVLPDLYRAGVTNLAWEFTNSRAQDALDTLLTSRAWDARACADLFVDLMGIGFAYEQYASVLEAAWRLNHELDPAAPPFRVVGLGIPSYVEDPDLLDGRSAGELELRNWWMGGHHRDVTAFHMVNVLTAEVIRQGQRAVVYCDIGRSTTRVVEWVDGVGSVTPGTLLHHWMGEGVQRVVFHGVLGDSDATARVEALIAAAPDDVATLGIDLELSTLGNVALNTISVATPERRDGFRLADVADGYLYLGPRADWTPCDLIVDLITPANYRSVEARYRALDPSDVPYSLDQLEEVRVEGRDQLQARWPDLPAPPEDPPKRGRFKRR